MLNISPDNYKTNNIFLEQELLPIIKDLKKQGKKIGLCTGSFDLLHPGHLTHFEDAKKFCDILIVAIALDNFSENKYPGSGRPIFSHDLRAYMISKLKPVDYVTFEDGTPRIIEFLKPDVYIKGGDYSNEKDPGIVKGREIVEKYGGKIIFTHTEKLSTSEIIKHIKEKINF